MFWSGFFVGVAITAVVAQVVRHLDHVWRTHQYCDRCGAELRHHPR